VQNWISTRALDWYSEDTMPGNHGGIVNADVNLSEIKSLTDVRFMAPLLVESQAKAFFSDLGVVFGKGWVRDVYQDLNRYGKLMRFLPTKDAWMGTHNYGFGDTMSETKGAVLDTMGKGLANGDRNMYQKTKRLVGDQDSRDRI